VIRPPPATARSLSVPVPIGMNTIDSGYAMPDSDCPLLVNLISAENGLRSRLGSQEWCTGLVGIADNTVRSVLPFTGSTPGNNRLFACTSKGIYDVSSSSAAPTLVVTFGTQTGDAGYGICHVVVNASGGHFLLYADEVNGYYVYTESPSGWVKVAQASSTAWAAATVYGAGARVSNGGLTYKTTAGGTSAAAPATGPSGTGAGIVDNTVTWDFEATINGVNPANFCFVLVWKNRVWFVEKNTGKAWYLAAAYGAGGAIYGTPVSFNFGAQFKNGGAIAGMYSWTVDGGSGADDRLVVISQGGDVIIYAGTDPASASTFGLVGRWFLGGVPAGRRIATEHGGDLLLLSSTGIIPLSRLVLGSVLQEGTQYSTFKIGNLFSRLVASYGALQGWAARIHPEDASLIVTVPVADGQATNQLAMSLVTKGWSQYRDLPILSMDAWGRKLYFGTHDGRVCINTGYVDGVLLSDPNAYTEIDCSGISRFRAMGGQTQITMQRATIISEGGAVAQSVEARYRYDLTEATRRSSGIGAVGDSLWGSAIWDVSKWGGAYATQQQAGGVTGMGPDVALAFRFAAKSRTVLVGFDVEYISGGFL
jgi:hypothetical protein